MKWKTKDLRLFIILTVAAIASASNGSAATISVKQLGCGMEGSCYSTISNAIVNALPGDIISVYPGRYNEVVTLSKDLTLLGAGPQVTTIASNGNGIVVNPNITATVIGFTISAAYNGIYLQYRSNTVIKNNCIISNVQNGIYMDGSYSGFSYGLSTTIVNNVMSFNSLSGIANNNYMYSRPNISISNNIIFSNGSYGIYLPWVGTVAISYNNVVGNASANYYGVVADAGDISLNPLFINYTNGNFALQSKSPSRNLGRPGSADANPDGTRNDMGAFGGPDAASFWPYPQGTPIITNLTITPSSVQKGGKIMINATGEVR